MVYDACLLELENPVDLVSHSEPIVTTMCLPPQRNNDLFDGANVTTFGWGIFIINGVFHSNYEQMRTLLICHVGFIRSHD